MFHLSRTLHFKNENNEFMQKFYGRLPLEFAASLYYFKKETAIQEIIHELKYRNKPFLGEFFAKQIEDDLMTSHQKFHFDYIVPVPLHPRKLKKRGYNQLDAFGKHLAKKLNITYVPDLVIKTVDTLTQTQKNFFKRNTFDNELFKFNDSYNITDKHILLIDDVVTTGITLEECGRAIVANNNCKLSLATISYTDLK